MTELFDEEIEEELLHKGIEDVELIVDPVDKDPMNARRRVEKLLEDKRLQAELEDFFD